MTNDDAGTPPPKDLIERILAVQLLTAVSTPFERQVMIVLSDARIAIESLRAELQAANERIARLEEALRTLHESKAMNAWGHDVVRRALEVKITST